MYDLMYGVGFRRHGCWVIVEFKITRTHVHHHVFTRKLKQIISCFRICGAYLTILQFIAWILCEQNVFAGSELRINHNVYGTAFLSSSSFPRRGMPLCLWQMEWLWFTRAYSVKYMWAAATGGRLNHSAGMHHRISSESPIEHD